MALWICDPPSVKNNPSLLAALDTTEEVIKEVKKEKKLYKIQKVTRVAL